MQRKKLALAGLLIVLMASTAYGAVVFYLSKTIVAETVVESPIDLKGELTYWSAEKGFFTTGGGGEVEWSSEIAHESEYSAKLRLPVPETDEARLVFSYDNDINSITGVSFQSYVQGGIDGILYPGVVLAVDTDGIGGVDAFVVQWVSSGPPPEACDPRYVDPLENDWREILFDDNTPVHVAGTRTGLDEGEYRPFAPPLPGTLGELKAEIFDAGPPTVTWGDLQVVQVKVLIGLFTGLTEPMTAYVDDIDGAVISDCEPASIDFAEEVPASIYITGGSEFFMHFEAKNLANKPIEAPFALVIEAPTGTEWTTEEIKDGEPEPAFIGTSAEYLVAVFGELGTIGPGATHELHMWVQFSEAIEPGDYVFRAVVIWAEILEGELIYPEFLSDVAVAEILEAAGIL